MKLRTEQPFHYEIAQHPSGWWLPAQVGGSFAKWRSGAQEHIDAVMHYAKGRDLAVQAGTHVGIYAKYLAGHFSHVHTFEPDETNFRCAALNLADCPNVTLLYQAIGATSGSTPMYKSLSNSGKAKPASPIESMNRKGVIRPPVEVVTLDALELVACDLLCLDVEGFELPALQGAERTIREFRPAILVEELGHGAFHGLTPGGVAHWLLDHGYREVEQIDDDHIWVPA